MILRRPAPDAVPSEALDTTAWLGLSGRRGWASAGAASVAPFSSYRCRCRRCGSRNDFFNLLVGCSVDDGERR